MTEVLHGKKIQVMAEAYKMLADKTRLTILALLKEQELCVCDITDIIVMSQPNASQHLRKLKSAGLLNEIAGVVAVLFIAAARRSPAIPKWRLVKEASWAV